MGFPSFINIRRDFSPLSLRPAGLFTRGLNPSLRHPLFHVCRAMAVAATSVDQGFEKIQIQRENGNSVFDVYVKGEEGAPGVVVVQEWWGVDYEVKNHASTIAKMGYRSLIPDLYRGKVGLDVAEAQHLLEGLDWQGAVKDIAASAKWLKENGSSKVGVTGFCMGGALSIASAVLVPEIDAAVAFYGVPPPELADASCAKTPVQGHFGELDNMAGFSDVEAAKSLEAKLQAAGVPYEIYIYPNNGHAFMNSSPDAINRKIECGFAEHDPEAVKIAWSRFDEWFGKYIKQRSSI
ncbi:hypothetical protein O6H91_Y433500 [Diphasiastrum complanatum]|nr:hypothetical protein O6H91_Y433500 [Diphasiastrum complanatum]